MSHAEYLRGDILIRTPGVIVWHGTVRIESQQFAKCNAEVLCIFCENVTGSGHQKFFIRRKMNFLRTSTVNDDFDIHHLQIGVIQTTASHARNIFCRRGPVVYP